MTSFRAIGGLVTVTCVSIVFTLLALFGANELAAIYLRKHPELLQTHADRINENTRGIRETMITPERAIAWYDLKSPDEVKPMWDEAYRAGAIFESYVHFGPRPLAGKYYGVTEHGYRLVKDAGPWPLSGEFVNVFFFGGSTSFGVGPYWATVASYLQEELNSNTGKRPVRVYNFGRSGWFSTQERILFQNLLQSGHRPDIVVFLDGLNDFCFHDGQPSGWQSLAEFFNVTNERYQREAAGYGVVTKWSSLVEFVRTSPLMRLTYSAADRAFGDPLPKYVSQPAAPMDTPESPATLQRVMDGYVSNMRQVKAVAESFGIAPLFIWQPIPTYQYDLRNHVFNPDRLGCHINSKVGYPLMRGNAALRALGRSFLWAADMQQDVAEPLYVDAFHYTAPMSRRVARFIALAMRERQMIGSSSQ